MSRVESRHGFVGPRVESVGAAGEGHLRAYQSINVSVQVFCKDPLTWRQRSEQLMSCDDALLTHGPVVSLRTEQPVHEKNGWATWGSFRVFMALVGKRDLLWPCQTGRECTRCHWTQ